MYINDTSTKIKIIKRYAREKGEKRPGPQLLFALRSRLKRWQQSLWKDGSRVSGKMAAESLGSVGRAGNESFTLIFSPFSAVLGLVVFSGCNAQA